VDKERRVRTEGLWQKCEGCRQIIWKKDLEANWNVCPKCGRTPASTPSRASSCCSMAASYTQFDARLRSSDPLGFVDSKPYSERLEAMRQATNSDA
jgi:acetyl-CoA carboxylase carboxyl transferase subunit beta